MDEEGNVVSTTRHAPLWRSAQGDGARNRNTPQRLHAPDGPDAGTNELHRAGQARPVVDVADDRAARTADRSWRSARREASRSSVRSAQAIIQRHRPRQSLADRPFEAPRMWDRGPTLELEPVSRSWPSSSAEMERRGHEIETPFKVAGGMNGILRRSGDGTAARRCLLARRRCPDGLLGRRCARRSRRLKGDVDVAHSRSARR